MNLGTATILRADARSLPIADNSVDLIVTSPPYFALRSYRDGGEHYDGQIGSEPTPAEFVDALIEVTRECVRVLKPTGSLWVNLGDKYAGDGRGTRPQGPTGDRVTRKSAQNYVAHADRRQTPGIAAKSLMGLPWRYAIRCIDELGLVLRAEVVWGKPNGLPESVTDRVRRSHEQWFHFTLEPRYYSALDEIREAHSENSHKRRADGRPTPKQEAGLGLAVRRGYMAETYTNPLGKLPGSVWTVPIEPLSIPDHVAHAACCGGTKVPGCENGVDHFAAFPSEWPKRIITGWSPPAICTACGEGRVPITAVEQVQDRSAGSTGRPHKQDARGAHRAGTGHNTAGYPHTIRSTTIIGYACACEDDSAPARPAIVLDPFGGTGTTAMVAKALGRHGIAVDLSADYCRLGQWRTNDRDQLAKVLGIPKAKNTEPAGEPDLFSEVVA